MDANVQSGSILAARSQMEMRLSRRHRLGELLDAMGIVAGVKHARRVLGVPSFPVIAYHRLAIADSADPFDAGVIDATPEDFDHHVAMLMRNFTLVGTREVRAHFEGRTPLPDDAAMITFDDGYRSCVEVALPILQQHGARAVFFVSTGHITERRLFWWDRVSYIVRRSAVAEIRLEYPWSMRIVRASGDVARVTARILRIVKDTYALDVERFLTELAQSADVFWSNELNERLADGLLLDWDQVRALRDAGMEIESHTRWHRVLDTLRPAELDDELAGSREDLEHRLGDPVRAIAYPVGISDDATARAVARAGYDLGFSNATGINDRRRSMSRFSVRRAAVDAFLPESVLRACMVVPKLSDVSPPRRTR